MHMYMYLYLYMNMYMYMYMCMYMYMYMFTCHICMYIAQLLAHLEHTAEAQLRNRLSCDTLRH